MSFVTLDLTDDQKKILAQPVDWDKVKKNENDMDYLPWTEYDRVLQEAFGIGKYLIIIDEPIIQETQVAVKVELFVVKNVTDNDMTLAAVAWGGNTINSRTPVGDALEGATSTALTRCCKRLGVFRELWLKDDKKPEDRPQSTPSRSETPKTHPQRKVRGGGRVVTIKNIEMELEPDFHISPIDGMDLIAYRLVQQKEGLSITGVYKDILDNWIDKSWQYIFDNLVHQKCRGLKTVRGGGTPIAEVSPKQMANTSEGTRETLLAISKSFGSNPPFYPSCWEALVALVAFYEDTVRKGLTQHAMSDVIQKDVNQYHEEYDAQQ